MIMTKIGVLGAGTWGMALARMLCVSGNQVTVWSALPQEIEEFSATRRHRNLPGMTIPEELLFTKEIAEVCKDKDILLFAVPSPFVRVTARKAAPYIKDGQIIVDVAKGIEADTLFTMTQIIADELNNPTVKLVALSGPTHAEEVAKDLPTTIVSACEDLEAAKYVQNVFGNTCMRVYTNDDVLGVELCGAMKNIMALASGVALGLGYGDNTKAALITRGMAEITRLGMAMGCNPQTFYGLAGIGDLIVTATSIHSRNNRCGLLMGQGVSPQDAIKQVGMVVEGINALPAAMKLAAKYQVEMPLATAVNAVVNEGADPKEAVAKLMARDQTTEMIH
jgi:glycerol-3-phosphate dehydrogenase (NAD(P)+)